MPGRKLAARRRRSVVAIEQYRPRHAVRGIQERPRRREHALRPVYREFHARTMARHTQASRSPGSRPNSTTMFERKAQQDKIKPNPAPWKRARDGKWRRAARPGEPSEQYRGRITRMMAAMTLFLRGRRRLWCPRPGSACSRRGWCPLPALVSSPSAWTSAPVSDDFDPAVLRMSMPMVGLAHRIRGEY